MGQLGLSDAEMSPDDFAANIKKIDTCGQSSPFILVMTNLITSNMGKSIRAKVVNDLSKAADYGSPNIIKIERYANGSHLPMKIELYHESTVLREKTIICYANLDGETMIVYPFREVAYVEKLPEIELLNGWELHKEGVKIVKTGNYVSINFLLLNGITNKQTTLFVLPSDFRPKKGSSIPIASFAVNPPVVGFIAVNPNGDVNLFGFENNPTIKSITCAGGFPI